MFSEKKSKKEIPENDEKTSEQLTLYPECVMFPL